MKKMWAVYYSLDEDKALRRMKREKPHLAKHIESFEVPRPDCPLPEVRTGPRRADM
jgi:hypothetical protein